MIGVSLPFRRLTGEQDTPFADIDAFLKKLKNEGVCSIELRAVAPGTDPDSVFDVVQKIRNSGMRITVHGSIKSQETAVSDIFDPLTKVLSYFVGDELIITVHPTVYDNVAILKSVSDYITENNLPVRIALENNRFMPDGERGDCIGFVLSIVNSVNRDNVGICFDMGHYYYNSLIDSPDDEKVLPPKEFLRKVIHTHIHALGTGNSTHFPFNSDTALPLKEYLDALAHNYFGVYNIELEHRRVAELYNDEEAWLESVDAVKKAMPFCGSFYDKIRATFNNNLKKASQVLKDDKDAFSLVYSSSYIVNTNGKRFGVDLAFRTAGKLSGCYSLLEDYFGSLDFMLVTHAHVDHFERQTAEALKDSDIKWIIPEFMLKTALDYGIAEEKIIVSKVGEKILIDDMEILPFEGKHFRLSNGQGIESMGYYVTSKKSPSMLFLGDVRDYTPGNISIDGDVDYLFSHVWLGDNVAGSDTLVGDFPEKFVNYMASFKPKNIVLAHLYESGRSRNNMWKICHATALSELFYAEYPQIKVHIPLTGDIVTF